MSQEHENAELNKILDKAFADMKKRISALLIKQEKKIMKDLKVANKTSRKPRGEKEREAKPKPSKEHKRSASSSINSSE
jgi:hypothetical protein